MSNPRVQRVLAVVILFCGLFVASSTSERRVVCYHGTWSVYRHGNGAFGVDDINPHLCTHLMYSFFGVTADGQIISLDSYLDLEENYGKGNIKKFNELKEMNHKLKTMAAIGGWNQGSKNFSKIANNAQLREKFAQNAANFALLHNFDGIDIDWEYPGRLGGNPNTDKGTFTLLMQALHSELSQHNLLLTAAVAATEFSATISYDIPMLVKYVDFLNVMTYDFHGAWDPVIGFNAPLFPSAADKTDLQRQLNVNASLSYWLSQGVPKDKLVAGIPFYGRSFRLVAAHMDQPGDMHEGPGVGGPYTGESGNYGFSEICEFVVPNPMWTRDWHRDQAVPYLHSHKQWIGYDDMESITIKANFINEMDLGGTMIWSIETDDFNNFCGMGSFPLLRLINGIFGNDISGGGGGEIETDSTTVGSGTTTAATSPPLLSTSSTYACEELDLFPDPSDCSGFFSCSNGVMYKLKCPKPLLFSEERGICDWPWLVDCKKKVDV